ncbi:MAG: efflux RND transporter periplasmic adaptor subunit [Lysobacteraceae bacterium]|nr:MAG: efflux RND transporter periplasmic adaptor subunit [Xanthomonadaceae bacterium]
MLLASLLAGCGAASAPPEPPKPVLVARADRAVDASSIYAFAGEIRAREETALSFRVPGKLARRLVDTGDRVRAGDVLAELDPRDLGLQADSLQAQLSAAEAQLVRARADHARTAGLARDQLVSRAALDQQKAALQAAIGQVNAIRAQRDAARNQAAYSQLRAPGEGAIAARAAEAGQVVAAGQTIFFFVGDGEPEVAFALPESTVRAFKVGQMVMVEPWMAEGMRLPARIREIAPAADPVTRTYAARALIEPPHTQAVSLGQSARVYIKSEASAALLKLPLAAIQRAPNDGDSAVVWVADPKTGRVRRVPVRIGDFGPDSVPVLAGLAAEDWVVVAGGHLLHDGQQVVAVDRSNRPIKPN